MSLKKQFLKSKPVCKVTFTVPKKEFTGVNEVALVGDFNNWDTNNPVEMKANKTAFKATVALEAGKEYQFRYILDGKVWENDPAADKYVPSPFGVENSVVIASKN